MTYRNKEKLLGQAFYAGDVGGNLAGLRRYAQELLIASGKKEKQLEWVFIPQIEEPRDFSRPSMLGASPPLDCHLPVERGEHRVARI